MGLIFSSILYFNRILIQLPTDRYNVLIHVIHIVIHSKKLITTLFSGVIHFEAGDLTRIIHNRQFLSFN